MEMKDAAIGDECEWAMRVLECGFSAMLARDQPLAVRAVRGVVLQVADRRCMTSPVRWNFLTPALLLPSDP